MKTVTELLLVVLVATLGAVATWKIAGPPERGVACDPAMLSAEEICLDTLTAEWPEGSFLWIDARSEEEWEKNGLPGSIHLTTVSDVPFDQQLEQSFEALSTASRVVVYCTSEACGTSKEVVKRLKELGLIPEVRALYGGWAALKYSELVKDSNPES